MIRIDLKKVEHNVKIGQKCEYIEPNITEDCILYEDGKPIGFFIKKIKGKLLQYIEIANKEFNSDDVPKVNMLRTNGPPSKMKSRGIKKINQYSTIIGAVSPKPHLGRNYPSMHSNHQNNKCRTFIKAMLLACKEAEKVVKKIMPEQYEFQKKCIKESVPKEFIFGNLFTSSISNYNIPAPFHIDRLNLEGCVNIIITKRLNAKGGNLHVPDYNATFDSCNNSMLVYPAWRNVHGVTPIIPTHEGGYRNSLIFYPLKAFKKYVK